MRPFQVTCIALPIFSKFRTWTHMLEIMIYLESLRDYEFDELHMSACEHPLFLAVVVVKIWKAQFSTATID